MHDAITVSPDAMAKKGSVDRKMFNTPLIRMYFSREVHIK
jgi:hypothetical protein